MKCTFCGYDIEKGTGKIKIMKDGRLVNLCSRKCEKNMFKLGRTARNLPWTMDYKVDKDMRMAAVAHHNQKTETPKEKAVKETAKVEKTKTVKARPGKAAAKPSA
jgi:large subunit ribosomal protein L24e